MHFGEHLADTGTVAGVRLAWPDAFQKGDDRRGPAGQRAQRLAVFVPHRLRTIQPAQSKVRHQAEKERQVTFGDALFIQRQDEGARRGVEQEVGILHALGDALVGQQFADLVVFQKIRKFVGGDGVNRHGKPVSGYSAASGRSERGNGKNSFSSAAETVSTCNSYRSANAPMISSTITSGAEAPAVMPRLLIPSKRDQSR